MAKIPKTLQSHINTAFPANVCLLGSVLPNGFAQVTPRGGTMVFDDEHIGLWERGTAKIYKSGPVYDEVWERLIQPEKDRDPDKKGYAVLIAVERTEDLAGQPLNLA